MIWTRTLFDHKQVYNERSNSLKVETLGIFGTEEVYEMKFNEENLKRVFDQRINDDQVTFTLKEEVTGKAVSVRPEPNINDTLKLFQKPFEYLFNADYISPQQKAELRQQAIDAEIITRSTPLVSQSSAPPKGTYS